ncbi:MAG TPA: hypothetical protein EYG81_02280 [Archaeoglobus profundus]|nr:hypothetical protein [Archaeoglobus profundus]
MMDIKQKIEKAEKLYIRYKETLLNNTEISYLLEKLSKAIDSTWSYMREVGITEICRECALETGSCCKRWVEDKFDEYTLLINLLLGVKLPKNRFREDSCFFLGPNGCLLKARDVICVTFLCERILKKIGDKEKEFQRIAGEELETQFILREKIIKLLL